MLAPKDTRKERQCRWPLEAAKCRGVLPQMSHLSGSPLRDDTRGGVRSHRKLRPTVGRQQLQAGEAAGLLDEPLVIHCGGCMLNEREVRYRTKCAVDQGVPITNYGTLIAYMNGILQRSIELFPELTAE